MPRSVELGGPGPEAAQRVSQGPIGQLFAERPCRVLPLGKRHSQSRANWLSPSGKNSLASLSSPLVGGGVLKGRGKPLQSHPSGGISSAPPPGRSPDCHLSSRSPGAKGARPAGQAGKEQTGSNSNCCQPRPAPSSPGRTSPALTPLSRR